MEKYAIRTYGHKILRKKASRVEKVDDSVKNTAYAMEKAMVEAKGLGIAAPQVGIDKRIIVFNAGKANLCLVNPRITWKKGKVLLKEGCLSFPGINLEIKRAKEIGVKGLDLSGREVEFAALELAACVIQHEIDHLDGVLIIDHIRKKELKPVEGLLAEIQKKSSGEK